MSQSSYKKVVLAYSGGLDTSVILKWLEEVYGCEVIAFCADLGQGEDLKAIKKKAQSLGVKKIYVEDLRETFVKDHVFPMLRGNAIYEGSYLLGTSIARPLIAKRQIEIAAKEGAAAVCHGATGKGNDQVRFELTYMALHPQIKIIAPWREWTMRSRRELIEYAEKHGIPVTATKAKPYSMDMNLFHTSYEGGILEDPWQAPPEEIFVMSVSPERAPAKAREVEIDYVAGDPVAVDGKKLKPAALLAHLNTLGGEHGVGRVDLVDLAVEVLPDPQAALGPGEARVAAVAGRRDRRHHRAGGRIDLVDARGGDLVQVRAVEGGAGIAGAIERARGLAAGGVEGDELRTGGGPHALAVVADAVDALGAVEGAVLANDLGAAYRGLRCRPGGLD